MSTAPYVACADWLCARVGLLPSHKLNATKLRTQSRREAVRSNYALNQSKKVCTVGVTADQFDFDDAVGVQTEWHRELMRSVEVKTAHADAVILKRKQDAVSRTIQGLVRLC